MLAGRWYALQTEHNKWLAVRAYSAEDALVQLSRKRFGARVTTIEPINAPSDIHDESWAVRGPAVLSCECPGLVK